MNEHMASAGSLDVFNLPTISADTKMYLHKQLSKYHVLQFGETDAGRSCNNTYTSQGTFLGHIRVYSDTV